MIKAILIVFCLMCSLAGESKAQVFLEEGKVNLDVSGGERISKSLMVHNLSADPMDIKIYWEDFTYQPPYDGAKVFTPSGSGSDSAGSWINFSPQSLTLPAYGKQSIKYSITVPGSISKGHYGSLFFERMLGKANDGTNVNIVTRVGCLFFIDPKKKSKKSSLQDITLAQGQLKGNFVNQGNVTLLPRMTYYVMSDSKMVVDRGELKKLYIPAGATAVWNMALPKDLKTGAYTIIINADLEGGDLTVKEVGISIDAAGLAKIDKVWD